MPRQHKILAIRVACEWHPIEHEHGGQDVEVLNIGNNVQKYKDRNRIWIAR